MLQGSIIRVLYRTGIVSVRLRNCSISATETVV
jgi:hypothetical protein